MRLFVASLVTGLTTSIVATSHNPSEKRASNSSSAFQWLGVNESGAEFGESKLPGQVGKDYTWPNK